MISSSQEILDSSVVTEIPIDSLKSVNGRSDLRSLRKRKNPLRRRKSWDLIVLVQDPDLELSLSDQRGWRSSISGNDRQDVTEKNSLRVNLEFKGFNITFFPIRIDASLQDHTDIQSNFEVKMLRLCFNFLSHLIF